MVKPRKIKTGIFGGSFNPIHIGHLALANFLCEYSDLDEVWFMVSPHNPLKEQQDLWDDNLRLTLVQKAIADYPSFKASDFEFHLPRPSYMIHTLKELQKTHPDREFELIIGADNWLVFPRWFHSEEIINNFQILIYPRLGYEIDTTTLPNSVRLIQTPIIEVSSTFIREAIQEGRDVRYFLHAEVYNHLKEMRRVK